MNILFVRLSYIGDILHATAAARWIKQHYPHAILHWIVTPSMAELLEHNPYVDVIIPWARDEYEAHSKKLHLRKMWSMWWQLRKQLQPYHFDVVVDVQGRLITGLVLLASKAPLRLGLGGTKELNWLFTNRKAKSKEGHVIERYIEVAELLEKEVECLSVDDSTYDAPHLLKMDLFITASERQVAKDQIHIYFKSSHKPRVGLVLGTSWKTKEWAPYKWQELVKSMEHSVDFICFGGPKEVKQYESLIDAAEKDGIPLYNRLGMTTLREMAALLEQCDVVVACDTGGLYMAIALGKPVVALFGPTDPAEWGPITGDYRIIQNKSLSCLGCRKRKCPKGEPYCMIGIDPIQVKEAIGDIIDTRHNS